MPQSPVFNTQASLALTQFFSLNGIFPSRGGGGSDAIYLGSIRTFAGNFDPGGSADANGQLIQIRNNTAVFSLLGTNFGGDGGPRSVCPILTARPWLAAERRLGSASSISAPRPGPPMKR